MTKRPPEHPQNGPEITSLTRCTLVKNLWPGETFFRRKFWVLLNIHFFNYFPADGKIDSKQNCIVWNVWFKVGSATLVVRMKNVEPSELNSTILKKLPINTSTNSFGRHSVSVLEASEDNELLIDELTDEARLLGIVESAWTTITAKLTFQNGFVKHISREISQTTNTEHRSY